MPKKKEGVHLTGHVLFHARISGRNLPEWECLPKPPAFCQIWLAFFPSGIKQVVSWVE